MAATIGAKLELNGAAKFKQDMANATSQTKLFQAQMKNLQSTVGKSTFSKSLQESKLLSQELGTLKDKSALLEKQIQEASEKYGENSTYVNKLRTQYENLQAQINNVDREIKEHGGVLGALGSQLQETGSKISAVGDKIAGIGDTLTTRVTLPLVAIGTKGALAFAEVDKTMTLTNSTMGNTAEQAKMLSNAMKQAAANSTFGMSDAATATLNFARAGLTAEQAAEALAPAMNLAAGEGGELETVSAGLVATINGFGDEFSKAADYADVFANACNNSALDVNSLSESMSTAAPIFSAAGYSVKDAALYMGTMANAGIDANTAANALKTGFARLVSPAKEGKAALDRLGISITNADGTMKDTVTIQRELNEAFSSLSESEQIAAASAIFGKNQMSNWLALINTAPEDVGALSDALGQEGTTAQMASDMMSGFGGSLEKLKSSIDVLVTSIGESLAPMIQKVADNIQEWVDWFNSLSDEERDQIVKIGMIVAAIGPLLSVGGRLVSGTGSIVSMVGKLSSALPGLAGGISGVAAPVLGVVAAIGALVAAFVYLYNTNDEFKAKVQNTWNTIQGLFAEIQTSVAAFLEALKAFWEAHSEDITAVLSALFDVITVIVETALNAIKAILDIFTALLNGDVEGFLEGIKNLITVILTGIYMLIQTYINYAKAFITMSLNIVKELVSAFLLYIKEKIMSILATIVRTVIAKVNSVVNTFTEMKNNIKATIDELIQSALNWGSDMIENFKQGITSKIQGVLDSVRSMAQGIKDMMHFSEPDKGPLKDFNSWPRDMMRQYAEGIENGRYLVQRAVSDVTADVALMGREGLSADEIYSAVNAGASDANISIVIGDRELGRALRNMGVVMA